MKFKWNLYQVFFSQRGAAMTELLVSLPALLMMGLGGMQTALLFDAKTTINYATFEAARSGAVSHAQSDAMRQELGLRLGPLFGGDGSAEKAMSAVTLASLDVQDRRFTKIEIINPTIEAFNEFGRQIVNPRTGDEHFGIPNSHLRWRSADVGQSGVNIQDANLLKIKVTYGYQLKVPLIDRVIPAVMRVVDPENSLYYNARRLPITSVATVRMQSDAWRDANNVHVETPGGGATPPGSGEEPEEGGTAPDDQGQGGDDDDTQTPTDGDGQDVGDGDTGSGDGGDGDIGAGDGGSGDSGDGDNLPPISDGDDNGLPPCVTMTAQNDTSTTPTAQNSGLASTHTGNPIHVVTGNKYQQEADLAPLPGPLGLLFKRHYNSHSDYAGPLGHGWSHSYDLALQAQGEGYRLRQSDGRVIHFDPSGTADQFVATRISDGWLRVNESQLTWHWRDGRQFQFSTQGQLERIVLASGQTLSLFYNPQGKLFLVRDPQGRELSLDHYPNGRIKALYDPRGKATRYRYDEAGNLQSITRSDGATRHYHYEDPRDKHNLTGVTDERGVRYASWAYDDQDRAILSTHADQVGRVSLDFSTPGETKVTDSQGRISTYTTEIRDGVALVSAIHGPGCSSCGQGDVNYHYNDQLQLTEIATKDGITKHYRYDEQGRTSQVSREVAGAASQMLARYEYENETDLKPSAVVRPSVNPNGEHRIENAYNPQGQPVVITERGYRPEADGSYSPIQRTTRLSYNATGNIVEIDGPREDVTDLIKFSYDDRQRINGITMADGSIQKILDYDAYGRPTKIVSDNQKPLTIQYNMWGKPLTISQGLRTVSYTYDGAGYLTGITDPDGQILNIHYDSAGRLVSMDDEEGNSVRKLIDTEDRLLAYTIESSQGDLLRATVYLRDANQRLRGVVTPEGIQRMVGYDERGQKTLDTNGGGKGDYFMRTGTGSVEAIADASGNKTRRMRVANNHIDITQDSLGRYDIVFYDDFDNKVAWRNPDSGLTSYRYDRSGNLIEKHDAAGNKTVYEYNAANQLVLRKNADGITRFKYRAGRLVEVQGPESKQNFTYDDEGRVVSHTREIDGHRFTTHFTYDAKTGKLSSRQLPGGERLAYRYQANEGRLSAVSKSGWFSEQPLLEGVTYEPFGGVTGYTHLDGSRTEKAYDKSGRLIKQTHTQFGQYKLAYNYSGELALIEKDRQQSRYAYDATGRLKQVDAANEVREYRYDALGNRLATSTGSLQKVNSKTTPAAGSEARKIDLLGRVTVQGERHWEYNASGRPIRFYRDERLVATYRYNHNGERISKTVYSDTPEQSPKTTYYLYDMQRRLTAEADETGTVIRQYLYLGRIPYAMLEGGVSYSIQSDHLGTPQNVTDENSRLKWRADYDPFGRAVVKTQMISFNLRRPGQYEDGESGLYDNYLRSYDPDNGRYLEPDPLGILDGMNRYAYVGSRPMDRTDPLGLFKVHAITGGDPVHEAILQMAFDRFNQEYAASHGGRVAFSQHTINLFVYANVRTDLILDENHQYLTQNHFDNPTDGPLNDGQATWFQDSINTVNTRRQEYGNISGEIRTDVCPPPGYEPIRENPDIMSIVENFGANTHTLADFYAHSNWVDELTRGGYYILQRSTNRGRSRATIEEGTVPTGLAMTSVWNETVNGYSLFSGAAHDLMDTFGDPMRGWQKTDIFGQVDKTTHAYWQKDAPSADEESAEFRRFEMARNLAIEHTLQEIRRLWDASENNTQLRAIYAMNKDRKEFEGVQYNLDGCAACPTWGSFNDIDSQIEYVAGFVDDHNW